MSANVDKLIEGYRRFRTGAFQDSQPLIQELVTQGQRPQICVVACSDSRVEPATLFPDAKASAPMAPSESLAFASL